MPKEYLGYYDIERFRDDTRLWWYSAYKYHLA